tara:strand:+ start:1214 stop:2656 length:1443 start_codon:yes stop_codon:yes gene_type:complete
LKNNQSVSAQRQIFGAALSLFNKATPLSGAVALFLILVATYVFSIEIRATNGSSITADEPFYIVTTQSIIEDTDLDLNNQYKEKNYREWFDHPNELWSQSAFTEDGRLLSPHNTGLPIFLVPGFIAAKLTGTQIQMLITTALTFSVAFLLTLRLTGSLFFSWISTFMVGITPTAFVYSTEIYPEVPAGLALLLSLLIVTRHNSLDIKDTLIILILMNAMIWLGIKYAPLALIVCLVLLLRTTWINRTIFVFLGCGSTFFYSWFHVINFGGLTPYAINLVYAGSSSVEIFHQHVSVVDRIYRIWGLFIDARFGIARWGFVLFLVVPGIYLMTLRGWKHQIIAGLIVTQVLIATFVVITMMGWWFPGRTLMTVVPLMSIPIVCMLQVRSRAFQVIFATLAVYTIIMTTTLAFAGHAKEIRLAVDPFDMSSPLFQSLANIFPNYTSWTAHTWITTSCWLTVSGALLTYLVIRRDRYRTKFRKK